ncbi:MAG TPA: hypothetical protein VGO41_05625 [Steroidobacteraceae bacterium]|jgi:hypothetical protein|nr:hypothetical protein [Steroidobacteraceae bacterium]
MKLTRRCPVLVLLALACGALPLSAAEWSPDPREAATPPTATRADLYKVLDNYLAALKVRDASRVKWAPRVRNTENNVALLVGDGLWGTITALGTYDLRFADTQTGQVAYFGTVTETEETAAFTLRLKVTGGLVAEVETLVLRQLDSGIKFEGQKFEHKPVMNEILPAAQRSPRARMISIADGYFDTLQLNDGTLFTKFHPNCKRVENGVQTTQNPTFAVVSVAALGCEEQFRMGNYRYDDRLRARRFPLVDEERGLVLAGGFIDHSGKLDEYKLTNGKVVRAPLHRPHSFYLMELFKIKDGSIEQIEANFVTVPYGMPSPWDDWRN